MLVLMLRHHMPLLARFYARRGARYIVMRALRYQDAPSYAARIF